MPLNTIAIAVGPRWENTQSQTLLDFVPTCRRMVVLWTKEGSEDVVSQ